MPENNFSVAAIINKHSEIISSIWPFTGQRYRIVFMAIQPVRIEGDAANLLI
ncbi:hypothetical protein HmCms168_02833 [Escherichia coli]|nr:hypothetical protein HmCms168_02833 [Escherichia coli]